MPHGAPADTPDEMNNEAGLDLLPLPRVSRATRRPQLQTNQGGGPSNGHRDSLPLDYRLCGFGDFSDCVAKDMVLREPSNISPEVGSGRNRRDPEVTRHHESRVPMLTCPREKLFARFVKGVGGDRRAHVIVVQKFATGTRASQFAGIALGQCRQAEGIALLQS